MNLPLPLPQILAFLKARTVIRAIVVVGFYGSLGLGIAKFAWNDQPIVHMTGYLALMIVLGIAAIAGGYLLRIARCPRCGGHFAAREGGKGRNNFASACLNCGLRLDGSNASE